MNTWIALLRGVTPTGKNRVPMAAFREALSKAGFQNARTWIQSGNALVTTALGRAETGAAIREVLARDIGAELEVIIKSAQEITKVLAGNPFADLPGDRVFYGLMNEFPDKEKAAALCKTDFGEDRLAITADALYAFIPGSAARSKLNNVFLQRKLGTALTFRNANTLGKLVEMAGDAPPSD